MNDENIDSDTKRADERDAGLRAEIGAADATGLVRQQEELTEAQLLGEPSGEDDG
jgi:hypothetical protein